MLVKAGLNAEAIVEKLSVGPRVILNLEQPKIEEGADANLVLFSTSKKWTFDAKTNKSKSANSPLFGQELTGKVLAVINNNQTLIND